MATITIPDINEDLRQRLFERAVEHGHSIEIEARQILENAAADKQRIAVSDNLYDSIRAIVEPLGGGRAGAIPASGLT